LKQPSSVVSGRGPLGEKNHASDNQRDQDRGSAEPTQVEPTGRERLVEKIADDRS
jgi:hypothetical protein